MSEMAVADRNKMALMYGALLGAIHVVVSTGANMAVDNMIIFNSAKFAAYLIYMGILAFLALKIRKANGGYIEFRDLFGAIFVMLLVGGFIAYVYNYLYTTIIIPDFTERLTNASLKLLEDSKLADDVVEEKVQQLKEQMKAAKEMGFSRQVLNFLSTIVVDCLFGLIVCAIVKKPKPLFD